MSALSEVLSSHNLNLKFVCQSKVGWLVCLFVFKKKETKCMSCPVTLCFKWQELLCRKLRRSLGMVFCK